MNSKKDMIEIILLGGILVVLVAILALTGVKTKLENDNKNNGNDNWFEEIFDNNSENNKDNENDLDKDKETIKDNNSSNNDLNTDKNDTSSGNNNSNNNKEENTNNDNVIENPESDKNENSNVIDKPSVNEQEDNNNNNNNNSNNNNNNDKDENADVNKNESNVVSYFTNLNNKLDNYNNENDKSLREKAKDIFTTTVDFLFYDGVIRGYTFDELSLATKLKVLKIVASIDNKIDSYFPNYKDTIKEKATNLKGKIAVLYLETTNKFCEKVGEDTCREAREDFNNMKDSFGYTWSILKETLSTSKDKLSLVLSEWYKSIK